MLGCDCINSLLNERRVASVAKILRDDYDIPIISLTKYDEADGWDFRVNLILEGNRSFCLSEIPGQCGWLTLGNFQDMDSEGFISAFSCLKILATSCSYAGMYVHVPKTKAWEKIVKDEGFGKLVKSSDGTLFHKGISYDE